jgi:hypothetical protein
MHGDFSQAGVAPWSHTRFRLTVPYVDGVKASAPLGPTTGRRAEE